MSSIMDLLVSATDDTYSKINESSRAKLRVMFDWPKVTQVVLANSDNPAALFGILIPVFEDQGPSVNSNSRTNIKRLVFDCTIMNSRIATERSYNQLLEYLIRSEADVARKIFCMEPRMTVAMRKLMLDYLRMSDPLENVCHEYIRNRLSSFSVTNLMARFSTICFNQRS